MQYIAFDGNSGYANAPEYYAIRILPVLLLLTFRRQKLRLLIAALADSRNLIRMLHADPVAGEERGKPTV